MTEKTYELLFGDYEPNGVFLKLSEECSDEIAYADDLGEKEGGLQREELWHGAGLLFLFAILVDLLMNRSLDEIDPVEASKSVE